MNAIKSAYHQQRWTMFWKTFKLPEIDLSDLVSDTGWITPPVTERLCLPPYEGPKDHNDVQPLLALINKLKPQVVLELGTAHGTTVANICATSDATVYTVNALPDQIEGNLTTYTLGKDEIGYVYKKNGYEQRVTQIYENTWKLDLTRYVAPHSVDFAVIDACHDAHFVVNDFFCVLPVLRDNAFVLFHDVHPSLEDHLRDSYVACMYLRKRGFNVGHLKSTWWAFWQADSGEYEPTAVAQVFNTIDQSIVDFRKHSVTDDVSSLRWLSGVYVP